MKPTIVLSTATYVPDTSACLHMNWQPSNGTGHRHPAQKCLKRTASIKAHVETGNALQSLRMHASHLHQQQHVLKQTALQSLKMHASHLHQQQHVLKQTALQSFRMHASHLHQQQHVLKQTALQSLNMHASHLHQQQHG
eukprot:1159109-Pelagomonas_calceolata.AAC.2